MLKEMREGAKSTVLKLVLFGLLLLAMTGLALMDVQGMFRGGVANGTIASFGREKMTAAAFDNIVQNTLRERHMKQSDAYRTGLPRQILKREIDSRLFSMAAGDLGLQVDDALAAQQLKEMIAPIVAKGLTEKEALQRLLQTYSLSEGQLVASLKAQVASQELLGAIVAGAHAPKQLVNDALAYRHEWRRGEYFRLTAQDIGGSAASPAEADLKAYYDSISSEYAVPETRTLSVIELDKKMLGDSLKMSADKLKQYYDDNISDYKTPETRLISQVIVSDEAAAKQIYAAAEKTKDLQRAAGTGKSTYMKAGSFTEASMPAELARTAFAAEAGKVLPPIKSPLGWHVLYIEKATPAVTKSFESVKVAIEKDLSQDKISEALYQRANKIDDEIAGGKTLAEVAKENNLQEIVLDKLDAHGLGANGKKPDVTFPLFDKVVENGFTLKKGNASPLIETPDGAFLVVAVRDVYPSEQKPFEKVRAEILARWQQNNHVKALADKSAKIMERLKLGESFEKIAEEFKKPVESTALVQRGTPAPKAKMDDNMMTALFSLDRTGQSTAVSGDGTVTLIRLAERKVQPLKEVSKEDASALEGILNRSLQQDLLEQYRLSLMDRYDVTVNDKLLTDMYTPKDEVGGGEN